MVSIFPHVPPEQMTGRARAYLFVTGFYCITIAWSLAFWDYRFTAVSFRFVANMLPGGLKGWAVAHLVVALLSLYASWRGSEKAAWRALMGATAMVGPWAAGLWWAFFSAPNISPSGAAIYTTMTAFHLIQARQPLRSPFEPVLRRYED